MKRNPMIYRCMVLLFLKKVTLYSLQDFQDFVKHLWWSFIAKIFWYCSRFLILLGIIYALCKQNFPINVCVAGWSEMLRGKWMIPYGIYLVSMLSLEGSPIPMYLFKVNNGNTGVIREICTKFTVKAQEWRRWRRSGVFFVHFEQI